MNLRDETGCFLECDVLNEFRVACYFEKQV